MFGRLRQASQCCNCGGHQFVEVVIHGKSRTCSHSEKCCKRSDEPHTRCVRLSSVFLVIELEDEVVGVPKGG
jgi:hypothetical protein